MPLKKKTSEQLLIRASFLLSSGETAPSSDKSPTHTSNRLTAILNTNLSISLFHPVSEAKCARIIDQAQTNSIKPIYIDHKEVGLLKSNGPTATEDGRRNESDSLSLKELLIGKVRISSNSPPENYARSRSTSA